VTVPAIELPAGSHYALTVNIPENYGGMTASMLQRSRAMVKYAGVEVTILTYDYESDLQVVRSRLRDRRAMVDGMHLANLWEDLRGWDDETLQSMAPSFTWPAADAFEPLGRRGEAVGSWRRELRDEDGNELQIDHLREDGSLLLSDQRNGIGGRPRVLTLCDSRGKPIGSWSHLFPLCAQWFDRLPRDPVAWIIVESKSSANMMLRYDRPDVAKLHVVRGSHLKGGPGTPLERELVASRKPVIENLEAWDSIVLLTRSQRGDIEGRFGARDNISVIPNSRDMPAKLKRLNRRPGQGIMLASLDSRKRIGHAIRAMAAAQSRVGRRRLSLDVWGRGPLEADLQRLIGRLKAPVTLRGHAPKAAEEFSKASFSLLTSRSEALPGVLLESMGRGCLPISYDLPYGPSDIITHGVDGFLVPFGDIDALADQVSTLVNMPRGELAAMREAAYRRAQDFSDEQAVERWASLLTTISKRRGFE
jgi:poly(glycerol-phosphate) alpha-glucosyltransferase